MSILREIRQILNKSTQIKFVLLLVAITIGAMLETLALSIISPFISILMDETLLETNRLARWGYSLLRFQRPQSFLAFLATMLASVYIFRGIYMYLLNKFQYRFIGRERVALSDQLMTKILGKSYLFHTGKNIAEMQRVIVTDVEQMFMLISNILLFCSDAFMAFFIIVYLGIASPAMTICVIAMALLAVSIYFKRFLKQAKGAGNLSREKYVGMTKMVNQAFGGIKEVKVLQREQYFRNQFKRYSDEYIVAFQRYQVMNAIPKLMIESFCFGIAFLLLAVLMVSGQDVQSMIPQLSLFVLAAFRLLPAVSRLTTYITNIVYYYPAVHAVNNNLTQYLEETDETAVVVSEETEFSYDITVANVTFQYPEMPAPVLNDICITIPEKKSVALVGPSGAGKTTLADIILGILTPQAGGIYYCGYSIHGQFDKWAMNVGYIPQQIYLLDETILENVAFGIDRDKIDEKKVWRALEQSQLLDYVKSLKDGLHTIVGDRGIRLSGGQRQRIGIARALYEDPPILVLDEATSALDTETEAAVMDAVRGFQGEKTMIIVAHRLTTIEHCDMVYRIENGTAERER